MPAEGWTGAIELLCRTTGLVWFCGIPDSMSMSSQSVAAAAASSSMLVDSPRTDATDQVTQLLYEGSSSLVEWVLASGISLMLFYMAVYYMKVRTRTTGEHPVSFAAGDGDYLNRTPISESGPLSDKSDSLPVHDAFFGPESEPEAEVSPDAQHFLNRFTSAYGINEIARSLQAQCLPLPENCFKLTSDSAEEGTRWMWLTQVPSQAEAASTLRDVRLCERINTLAKTGSENYCTAFRTSDWIWFIKEKVSPQPAKENAGREIRHVVVLEKHFAEYPIDLGNLATLGVDRITAMLRQITLAFEVFRKLENVPTIESLKWKLTLAVHDEYLIEFWVNEELHIAPSHGVQVRLSPTELFGGGRVDLVDFLLAAIVQVPILRPNPDFTKLSRLLIRKIRQ